jgi:EmrB/QacA subfamily drug resistance transporter
MALASGITSIPSAAIVLAIPTLHVEFDASVDELQWTVVGYLLTYSTLLIPAGRISDLYGRKKVHIIGIFIYMGGSVVGAVAPSAIVLIVGMVIAGIGAAILTPASLAIITQAFTGSRRATAIGVWGSATAVFSGIAPAVGGVLTDELSWRWILWLNVIAGILILIGVRIAPESRDEESGPDLDVIGLIASFAGLAAITLALNETPATWALDSPQVIGLLVAGVVLLAFFVVFERRVSSPLLDLGLFRKRNISGAGVTVFVLNFAFGAALFFVPTYLQELLGYDALQAGLLMLPATVTMMAAMPAGAKLYDRIGPLIPIVTGMAIAGVAMLFLGQIDAGSDYSAVWWPLALLGLGIGAALTPLNLAALNAAPQRQHGAVGAVLVTLSGLGATFGVALTGALNQTLWDEDVVDAAASSGQEIDTAAADTLTGLLAGAPSATDELNMFPASEHEALTGAVREGYFDAFQASMILSTAIMAGGIVLALVLIRRRAPVDDAPLPTPNQAAPFSGVAQRP